MDLKLLLKALYIKAKSRKKYFVGSAASYISLFLVFTIILGSAYAWFKYSSTSSLTTDNYSMNGASGIRNDKTKKSIDEVKISSFKLDEASSVDGRNIFFPTSMFNNASDNNSSDINTVTNNIVYREANAGDKTERYAYAQAELSGSSDNTKVWIRGYTVKISNYQNGTGDVKTYRDELEISSNWDQQVVYDDCPVRIAIISDSGDDARVFDPSAIVKDYVINSDSVYYISEAGVPTTQYTRLDSFSSYYYGSNNPLFTLNKDETKTISVVAWLEGTHPNAKDYEGKWLSIDLEIETNISDMGLIYFHDYTSGDNRNAPPDNHDYEYTTTKDNYRYAADYCVGQIDNSDVWAPSGHWITNDNAIVAVSYYDTLDDVTKTTVMHHMENGQTSDDGWYTADDDYTYCAAIPSYVVSEITFFRLASFDQYLNDPEHILKGNVYNAWHTSSKAPYTNTSVSPHLTNKAATWQTQMGMNMAPSRTIGGTTYWHYFAIRGNGYGIVSSSNGNNNQVGEKYREWLAPCVGYWGTDTGTIKGYAFSGNPPEVISGDGEP